MEFPHQLQDFWAEAPTLEKIFKEFELISGLRLNLGKCITIPLGTCSLDAFTERRNRLTPQWSNMPVALRGKYLGFHVGPEKGTHSWDDPKQKYMQRSGMW